MKYLFEDFVLDLASRTLYRGERRCLLEPLAFDVLAHLCEHPHHVVSTESLYARHWPDVVVTPNSLTRVIAQIRKTLGDDHRAPRFIETVPKTGYRFIKDVEKVEPSPGKKRLPIFALLAVGSAILLSTILLSWPPSEKTQQAITLVVFPFESAGGVEFADSFSQELLEEFYTVPDVSLRSFLAADKALKAFDDPTKAARSLNATHYISGRVEQSAQTTDLIFYTELIDSDTEEVVWSQRATKSFNLQANWSSEIKARILESLLGLPVREFASADTSSPDPKAYRLYLQAKYIWLQRGKQPMGDAIYMLREAVTIDPTFAEAWDSLAAALGSWRTYEDVPDSVFDDADAAARRAIELNPNVSYSYMLLYQNAYMKQRYHQAFEFAQQMKNNASNNAMAVYWLATSLRELGHMQASLEHLRQAIALDPTIWVSQADFAVTVMHTADVRLAYKKMIKLWDAGGHAIWLWRAIFQAKLMLDKEDELESWLQEAQLNDIQRQLIDLEMRYFKEHETDRAQIVALLEREDINELDNRTVIFTLHYLQQKDLLFDYLESRLANQDFIAIYALAVLSPDYINDPRMISLFKRLGLLDYWQKYVINDVCESSKQEWQCHQYQHELTQQEVNILTH